MSKIFDPQAGDRLWFADERNGYTVQAVSPDGRWIVCTKPFTARKTVLYTVVDRLRAVRGRDNYGGLGYETPERCAAAARKFGDGTAEHSHRHPPISAVVSRYQALTPSLPHP